MFPGPAGSPSGAWQPRTARTKRERYVAQRHDLPDFRTTTDVEDEGP